MNSLTDEKVIQHFLDEVNKEAMNRRVSQLELLHQLLKQWVAKQE
jgi:hypothetical protein